ncbi:MAG: ImmA/IrrE family metallo-endopeptidase [Gammaproteobacteria bacterium]|nr:MAG: ImmA/IrrE family metallo-endopeptidase [Gammaproteobacteria bacterium]
MTNTPRPKRVANEISIVLRTVFGNDRFPVNVSEVAREISAQKFPDDPLTMIKGADLPGFEGALTPAPPGKRGWGIIYNNTQSPGRINFTLGHEFGHYLLHRLHYPEGFQCSTEDMAGWDSEYGQLEYQANDFAATLLMPLDDFRTQIQVSERADFDVLGACATRYDVSLIAAILRWLQFTTRRSVLVVSRDGFILWARSSKAALKSGLYYKTRGRPPIPVPEGSLAARRRDIGNSMASEYHDTPQWLKESCHEHVLFSDQYYFTLSLLHFGDALNRGASIDEEPFEDAFEHMQRVNPGSSWLD